MIVDEESACAYVAGLCDGQAMERLRILRTALREENERQNLVSRGTLASVWQRHIADSAQLIVHVSRETSGTWLDMGTGAGFPGLVIAALRPDLAVVLVESRRKRIEWLERMQNAMGLTRCRIEGNRIELVESFPAAVISARAFAPLPRLLHLAQRFSTKHTLWLLPKGRSAAQELAELPRERRAMFHVEPSLTDPGAKILVGKEANRA